jgi:hypothetical protein
MEKRLSQMTDAEYKSRIYQAEKAPASEFMIFNSYCLGYNFFDKDGQRVYKDKLFRLGCRCLTDIEKKGFIIKDRPKPLLS